MSEPRCWVGLLLVLAAAASSANRGEDDETYVNLVKLVSDFRDNYRAFNVFIARSEPATELRASTAFVALLKRFSQQNVYAMITRITEIPRHIAYTSNKMKRQFFVIIIRTMNDYYDYANITKVINMNLYQSLLIFPRNLMEVCRFPKGNPFNLVFDSKVLVKCQDFPIVREWYSLHPHETKMYDFLIWKPEVVGFIPLTNLSFYERRNSLEGISLRVTTMKDTRNLYLSKDSQVKGDKMSGFFGSVVKEIAHVANFKIALQPPEEVPGAYDPATGTWTGVMGKLFENKTDIGVGEFTVTQERLNILDFSDPIFVSKSNFYLKKSQESHVLWSMYYKAFGVRASYCLLIVLVISPILLAVTMSRQSRWGFGASAYDSYFNVWGIFCAKSLSEFPSRSSTRIAYYSLYILSFMLYSAYSALLVSYFTIFKPDMPFNSLEEFTLARTHKITTVKNTSFTEAFKLSEDESTKRLNRFLLEDRYLPSSLAAAIEQICDDNQKVVLYMDDIILQSNRVNIPCKLIPFERGRLSSMGIAFVKNSPYLGLINFHLQRIRNFGLLSAIKQKSVKAPELSPMSYQAVTIWSTMPLFAILHCGFMLSILIVIVENVVFCIHRRRQRPQHIFQQTSTSCIYLSEQRDERNIKSQDDYVSKKSFY